MISAFWLWIPILIMIILLFVFFIWYQKFIFLSKKINDLEAESFELLEDLKRLKSERGK